MPRKRRESKLDTVEIFNGLARIYTKYKYRLC